MDDLLVLTMLSVLCGLLAGATMIGIVAGLKWLSHLLLPAHGEDYEGLTGWWPFLFPVISAVVLSLIWMFLPQKWQKVGIPYVVERLNYQHGSLLVGNAVVQLVGAFIGLLGGLSIGKEGPAVHIGATFGSQLAQRFRLTHSGVETLVACGVSGAIAAAFQTPIAGVLFAFEVIFLEYRLRNAIPVMLSAVVAALLSEVFLGTLDIFAISHFALSVPTFQLLPSLLLMVVGVVMSASLFYRVQKVGWRLLNYPVWARFIFVGLLTGGVAMVLPSVLGGGYDTLNQIFSMHVPEWLTLLLLAKILLTGTSIGLGIPGGMIGPTFVIGGLLGMQVGVLFQGNLPDEIVFGLFPLLGMASMMAATFQAPLTALIAVLEMTQSSQAMLPSLLVITLSCLVTRLLLHQDSVFVERLHAMGLVSSWDPVEKLLRHSPIREVCSSVQAFPQQVEPEQIRELGASMVEYALTERDGQHFILEKSELLNQFYEWNLGPQPWLSNESVGRVTVSLDKMVGWRPMKVVEAPDTAAEALSLLNQNRSDRLVLAFANDYGLISRFQIDKLLIKEN